MKWNRDNYHIITCSKQIDFEIIHDFLSREAYWCKSIPVNILKKAFDNSLCFAILQSANDRLEQIGFARVVTDGATFAYLADVFLQPDFRGKGLSEWLIACILSHPTLRGLPRVMPAMRGARSLSRRFGFKPLPDPDIFAHMEAPSLYRPAR